MPTCSDHAPAAPTVLALEATSCPSQNPANTTPPPQLSPVQRMAAAALGSATTSLSMTPFDVVKTRIMAQRPLPRSGGLCLQLSQCDHFQKRSFGTIDLWCRACAAPRPSTLRFQSSWDCALKLIKHEGPASLWRGLTPALLMSVPQTAIYFSLYDHLRERFSHATLLDARFAPILAGTLSRSLTVTLVSPIELLRTKMQSGTGEHGLVATARHELASHTGGRHGVLRLWRGLGPTLWRDVPFSAMYWWGYEHLKQQFSVILCPEDDLPAVPVAAATTGHVLSDDQRRFAVFFTSGAIAGSAAAMVTHPFDLVKTRRQIELYELSAASPPSKPSTTSSVLRTIIAEEGYLGLFTGLVPRMAKIAPACAIMISSYEVSKRWLLHREQTLS